MALAAIMFVTPMLHASEAIVLRTYPMHESDLLVTLFTRNEGKIKGVAKAAKRSKRRFGGALEPLTIVRAQYEHKPKQELARFDAFEIIESPLTHQIDYAYATALAYIAEVLDQLLPEHDPNDDVFRLTAAVLHQLSAGSIWMPLTYFDLWITRLMGLLPELTSCIVCGTSLSCGAAENVSPIERISPIEESSGLERSSGVEKRLGIEKTRAGMGGNGSIRAYYHALADGLMCIEHKRLASSEMTQESRQLAAEMFHSPVDSFAQLQWPRARAADLRKFLVQSIERHIEKKLVTAVALGRLD
jgi:DNA repair protein RecO (recombination protein O)